MFSEPQQLKLRILQVLWEDYMDPLDVYDKIIGHYGQLIRYINSLSETLL